jgi:hypothetical protein
VRNRSAANTTAKKAGDDSVTLDGKKRMRQANWLFLSARYQPFTGYRACVTNPRVRRKTIPHRVFKKQILFTMILTISAIKNSEKIVQAAMTI